MNLGEESVIVWWVPRIIMAGGMIMCGWILIFLGRLARTGKYGRDDAAGIRTANTLASEEAWKVGHIFLVVLGRQHIHLYLKLF